MGKLVDFLKNIYTNFSSLKNYLYLCTAIPGRSLFSNGFEKSVLRAETIKIWTQDPFAKFYGNHSEVTRLVPAI
jgi:hypothetical protein